MEVLTTTPVDTYVAQLLILQDTWKLKYLSERAYIMKHCRQYFMDSFERFVISHFVVMP